MADAARDEPDENLTLPGLRELELLHLERCSELLEDGGADLHPDPTWWKIGATPLLSDERDRFMRQGAGCSDSRM